MRKTADDKRSETPRLGGRTRGGFKSKKDETLERTHDANRKISSRRASGFLATTIGDKPRVLIVGRPNTGKSTLFNRLLRMQRSPTTSVAGMTQDWIEGELMLPNGSLSLIDTAGAELDGVNKNLDKQCYAQAWHKTRELLEEVALVLFVLDARTALTSIELDLAKILRGKRVIVVANKGEGLENVPEPCTSLGFAELLLVSALQGQGIGRLLDCIDRLTFPERPCGVVLRDSYSSSYSGAPIASSEPLPRASSCFSLALLGVPNSGKSTLANRLLGDERMLVSEIAGTTRNAVDALWHCGDECATIVDTAGLRRRSRVSASGDPIEEASSRDSLRFLRMSSVVALVIDSPNLFSTSLPFGPYDSKSFMDSTTSLPPPTSPPASSESPPHEQPPMPPPTPGARPPHEQPPHQARRSLSSLEGGGIKKQELIIAKRVLNRGKPLMLLMNKWDLVSHAQQKVVLKEIVGSHVLPDFQGLPIITLSALYDSNFSVMFKTAKKLHYLTTRREKTAKVNAWLEQAQKIHRPPIYRSRQIILRYASQVDAAPPLFVIHANAPVANDYVRYLKSSLRRFFDWPAVPIVMKVIVKEQGRAGAKRVEGVKAKEVAGQAKAKGVGRAGAKRVEGVKAKGAGQAKAKGAGQAGIKRTETKRVGVKKASAKKSVKKQHRSEKNKREKTNAKKQT